MAVVKLEIVIIVGDESAILAVMKGLWMCLRRDVLIMVG